MCPIVLDASPEMTGLPCFFFFLIVTRVDWYSLIYWWLFLFIKACNSNDRSTLCSRSGIKYTLSVFDWNLDSPVMHESAYASSIVAG